MTREYSYYKFVDKNAVRQQIVRKSRKLDNGVKKLRIMIVGGKFRFCFGKMLDMLCSGVVKFLEGLI